MSTRSSCGSIRSKISDVLYEEVFMFLLSLSTWLIFIFVINSVLYEVQAEASKSRNIEHRAWSIVNAEYRLLRSIDCTFTCYDTSVIRHSKPVLRYEKMCVLYYLVFLESNRPFDTKRDNLKVFGKVEVVLAHPMKAYSGCRCMTPLISNLDTT